MDTIAFSRCAADTGPVNRVEKGLRAGNAYDVKGTPTVLVNGLRFATPPTELELAQAIDSILIHQVQEGQRKE